MKLERLGDQESSRLAHATFGPLAEWLRTASPGDQCKISDLPGWWGCSAETILAGIRNELGDDAPVSVEYAHPGVRTPTSWIVTKL